MYPASIGIPTSSNRFRFFGLVFVSMVCSGTLASCSVYDEDLIETLSHPAASGGGGDGQGDDGQGDDSQNGVGGGSAGSAHSGGNTPDAGLDETCGNGRVTDTERCDIAIAPGMPGACPTECPANEACLQYALEGTNCHAQCVLVTPNCMDGDDCCPPGCTRLTDSDCSASCGDGVVQADEGEICEPSWALQGVSPDAVTACPTECEDDGDPCTQELLSGSEDNCNAQCSRSDITSLVDGDMCCPEGANANTDGDCDPVCGNQIREGDEECDGAVGCDDQCKSTMTDEQRSCVEDFDVVAGACEECMCTNCTDQAITCFGSGDATKDMHCSKMADCGYQYGCVGLVCYCGTAPIFFDGCTFGANGPCKTVIEEAAGTTNLTSIFFQQYDGTTALGRGLAFSDCYERNCLEVCH